MQQEQQKGIYAGVALAILAAIIWSGNFIVARLVINNVPPVTLAFFRWTTASLIIFPFAYKQFVAERKVVVKHWLYFTAVAVSGVTLFNTFVYLGAHYTTATNLALIGTTSSPIMAIILARIFLKEKIGLLKIVGVAICVTGVLFLLIRGNFKNLLHLHFENGDLLVLAGAFCFAVYNVLARKKPTGVSPINFLFIIFSMGTLMLLPFYLLETSEKSAITWNKEILISILYLGVGASVICFLIWNSAIKILGAGRTALFGNLIPIFSSIEAALLLHEKFTLMHAIGILIIFIGIITANFNLFKKA